MSDIRLDTDLVSVGRDREAALIAALLDDACAGRGGALIVRGDPGIGKTRLLADTQRAAEARHMRRLNCRGVQAEANLPFAGLHQLLRPIMGVLASLSARQSRLIRAAFGSEDIELSDLYGVALATLELLAAAAADEAAPVLIVADDVHWVDRPSADVLAFVGRRIAAEPIAMVMSARTGTDDLFAARDLPEVVLAPLDAASAASLLDRVAPKLTRDIRERVLSGAAGNPLALIELPVTASASGPLPDRMPVDELLQRSFAARIWDLSEPTRVLLLAAAAEASCSLAELCIAASDVLGRPVSPADLQPAIDARLVKIEDKQVEFYHPLKASAIYQSAPIDQRLAMHKALARLISHPDRRVWHRAAATLDYDDVVATDLEVVAERAARRGALSVSIAALDRAAALTSDGTRRADALLLASERAVEIGRGKLALDLARRADRGRLSPAGRARMLIVAEGVTPWKDSEARSVATLITAAQAVERAGDRDLAALVLWRAANRSYWTSASEADRLAIRDAVTQMQLPIDDPLRLAALAYIGVVSQRGTLLQEVKAAAAMNRDDLNRDDLNHDDLNRLLYLGSAVGSLVAHRVAAPLLADAVRLARRQGRLGIIARLLDLQGWATLWSGSMDSVTAIAGEAAQLSVELDQPMWRDGAILLSSLATGMRGDYAAVKEQVRLSLHTDEIRNVRLFQAMALFALSLAALGVGEYQDAYANLRRIVDPADPMSHYAARAWVNGDLQEAAVGAGRVSECAELLAGLREEWLTDPTPNAQHWTSYGDALLLGSDADAGDAFAAALAADTAPTDVAHARLQLAYGSWLRRHRRPREARDALSEANDLFRRLGLDGFADRAGRELGAAGGEGPNRSGGLPRLTAQELQIAQLATTGLSNRQIAEQLFLSHRTVGSHLYHIFPKLGITTRSQLADALTTNGR